MKYDIEKSELRTYLISESCIFKKNNEEYGGLSNMATNYPIIVNDIKIRTTEALYQACRFPYNSEIQKIIIAEPSPMKVKMISNSNKLLSREDWDDIKVKIMRWCINVKLAQNILTFGELLNQTSSRYIVENSSKDNFWGAIPDKDENVFTGKNALGRLLMELRQKYQSKHWIDLLYITPPEIDDFYIFDLRVKIIDERQNFIESLASYWKSYDKNFNLDVKSNLSSINSKTTKHFSNLGKMTPPQGNLFQK